jgi:hypothetical protein
MQELIIECLDEGQDIVLGLMDNRTGTDGVLGEEVYINVQNWADVNFGHKEEPYIDGITLDRPRAQAIVDYLTCFYRLGGLH